MSDIGDGRHRKSRPFACITRLTTATLRAAERHDTHPPPSQLLTKAGAEGSPTERAHLLEIIHGFRVRGALNPARFVDLITTG